MEASLDALDTSALLALISLFIGHSGPGFLREVP